MKIITLLTFDGLILPVSVNTTSKPVTYLFGGLKMQYNKVEICGLDTSKLKVMSEKEKMELLKKAQSGDKKACDDLVKGNLKLVLSVVQRFSNRGENPEDLFQVGVIGLIKAIKNFDTTLDVRFSTYSCPMIIGEIRRYLRDNNAVRVSRSMRDTAYHAMQVKEKIQNKYHREATVDEIAKELNLPRENVVIALEAIVDPVSLFEPIYSDNGDAVYVMDQVGDTTTDLDWIDEIVLRESLQNLNDREKKIMHMRFMRGMTQMEVASEIGISQAQVSRLEKSVINRIKNPG